MFIAVITGAQVTFKMLLHSNHTYVQVAAIFAYRWCRMTWFMYNKSYCILAVAAAAAAVAKQSSHHYRHLYLFYIHHLTNLHAICIYWLVSLITIGSTTGQCTP